MRLFYSIGFCLYFVSCALGSSYTPKTNLANEVYAELSDSTLNPNMICTLNLQNKPLAFANDIELFSEEII